MSRQVALVSFFGTASLLMLACIPIYQVHGDTQEGLLAYFKCEEGGGKDLVDSSGEGNDADIKGDVEWVDGKYDKGVKFDGKSSYAEIAPGRLGPFDEATLAAWIKINKKPTAHSYNIAGMTTGPGQGFYLELYPVNLTAWQCGPNMNATVPYVATFGDWHHVAAVYSGDDIRIYIDGEMKTKAGGTALPKVTAMPFRIGGDHGELQEWGGSIDGIVDEVRLYDRALSDDDVKEAMNPDQGQAVTAAAKLLATWASIKNIH